MWNGMRINSPMLGMTDFSMIPSYFVDDATLLHGTSSLNVVGGGLGGAITLATKPADTHGFKMQYTQGIGMAMYEDVTYSDHGRVHENSFMQYKVPSRLDIGKVKVEFECSYEPTGPFGAKSIGEIVINTPSPAIANAVYNAVGVRIRELPITDEKIFIGIMGGR